MSGKAVTPGGALSGVRVIDMSRVLGGPFCGQILADHGADVIKVEPPMGDETREWGPPFRAGADGSVVSSAYFMGTNRNKRGIALDLKHPRAREVCLELFATTDVVIENFKVGTMEKWGLGYADALAERFPRLIYCRITGFGPDGPLGKLPGYDAVAQAMTGLISITGMPQSGPVRMGAPIVDLGSGMNAALGIAMALYERERSGLGQLIDITLFDTGLSFLHPHSANWLEDGRLAPLSGNAHPNIAPYDLFPTRTRPIFLGIGNDRQFAIAARVLGAPHLAKDPRFASNAMRKEHTRDLTAELSALLAEWDGDELARLLLEAGVPAGPANTVAQALSDPHTRHRGMIAELDGYRGIASPIKLARSRPRTRKAPPAFAADNHDVLAEAGFDEETIAELLACGAVVAKRRTGGSD